MSRSGRTNSAIRFYHAKLGWSTGRWRKRQINDADRDEKLTSGGTK